jgi:hypothetical protein
VPRARLPLLLVVAGAAALSACRADAPGADDPGTSEDLLVTDATFVRDVAVFPDRLEVPRAGHDDLLALPEGKLLTGGPSGDSNPYGFLRRATGVHADGDRIVIDTGKAELTDVFHGRADVSVADGNNPSTDPIGDDALHLNGWGSVVGGLLLVPAQTVLFRYTGFRIDPVQSDQTFTVSVVSGEGGMSFSPKVTTDVQVSGGELQALTLSASGKLDVHLSFDVSVKAEGSWIPPADRGLSQPLHFDTRLGTLRPVRAVQVVGLVPVWETVELSLVLRCDMAFNGELELTYTHHAVAEGTFGAEYTRADGFKAILDGPTLDTTGSGVDVTHTGAMEAKCSLEPQVALMVYDLVGPTLAIGPYAQVHLDDVAHTWSLQPGVRADLGVFVEFAQFQVLSDRFSFLDKTVGDPYTGTLP